MQFYFKFAFSYQDIKYFNLRDSYLRIDIIKYNAISRTELNKTENQFKPHT